MIKINVFKQSNYPISVVKVKNFLSIFLKERGISSDALVNLSFVSEKKMLEIGKKYYKKDNKVHNVFSFVESEVKNFKNPNSNIIYLGEIIVCFPAVIKEAIKENKLIEEKVLELVSHSALHLLGIHHKE